MLGIGDKVIFEGEPNEPSAPGAGATGIIRAIEPNETDGLDYGIEFEGFKGHSCSGIIPSGQGFWCDVKQLRKESNHE